MNALDIIKAISQQADGDLTSIRAALEDGAALAAMGVTDDDKEAVESAHDTVTGWLKSGNQTLAKALA